MLAHAFIHLPRTVLSSRTPSTAQLSFSSAFKALERVLHLCLVPEGFSCLAVFLRASLTLVACIACTQVQAAEQGQPSFYVGRSWACKSGFFPFLSLHLTSLSSWCNFFL